MARGRTKSAVSYGLIGAIGLFDQGILDLNKLYKDEREAPCGNVDLKATEEYKRLLETKLPLRKQFYFYLIECERRDLAEFFQANYLLALQLRKIDSISQEPSTKSLLGRINSAAKTAVNKLYSRVKHPDLEPTAIEKVIALYEFSIDNRKIVSYPNQDAYANYLQGLSRKEKVDVYTRLRKINSDAANYFSQRFMFRESARGTVR